MDFLIRALMLSIGKFSVTRSCSLKSAFINLFSLIFLYLRYLFVYQAYIYIYLLFARNKFLNQSDQLENSSTSNYLFLLFVGFQIFSISILFSKYYFTWSAKSIHQGVKFVKADPQYSIIIATLIETPCIYNNSPLANKFIRHKQCTNSNETAFFFVSQLFQCFNNNYKLNVPLYITFV